MKRNGQESQGKYKIDKKEKGAATGLTQCFVRAPYRARPGALQATEGTGDLKSCRKGGQQ